MNGDKVNEFNDLGEGNSKYIYTDGELYKNSNPGDEHRDILVSSGKKAVEVKVAGAYTVSGNRVIVDGDGSISLGIEGRDPDQVVNHIKSLSGSEGKEISALGHHGHERSGH